MRCPRRRQPRVPQSRRRCRRRRRGRYRCRRRRHRGRRRRRSVRTIDRFHSSSHQRFANFSRKSKMLVRGTFLMFIFVVLETAAGFYVKLAERLGAGLGSALLIVLFLLTGSVRKWLQNKRIARTRTVELTDCARGTRACNGSCVSCRRRVTVKLPYRCCRRRRWQFFCRV